MLERLRSGMDAAADRVGGKAAGLVRLLDAGLTVPEAWVIPAAVSGDREARKACVRELATWWKEASEAFPGSVWAVRSSAVAEDLADASFAGVYETVLGVDSKPALTAAVKRCWAAHDADRAKAYREATHKDDAGGIALVVQRMLQPRVAGVLLTTNPRRAFADEIVVDASWGLGEAIVSGRTDPDHLTIVRSTGELRHEHIGAKQVETVYGPEGIEDREVDEDRRTRRCLDDAEIAALYGLATKVGAAIGPSRDLEWAIEGETLYALQDRPITGLPPADPTNVWTRKMGDEYLSEYSMPLAQDLMGPWMGIGMYIELMMLQGRGDLLGIEPIRNYNGYSFMSGQYLARVARAFPPGMRTSTFGDWFTPLWIDKITSEPWRPQHLIGMVRAPFKDTDRGTINANVRALERHCAAIDEKVVPKLAQDYRALDLREWRAQMDELEDFGLDHFRVIRWGMGPYNTVFHKILEDVLRKEAGDEDGELYHAIISGLSGTHTAALNREVWALGMTARGDEELLGLIRDGVGHDALRAAAPASAFWPAFDAFMAKHGHRSASRDIAKPRWRETPEVILGFVRAQVQTDEPTEDPRVTEARAEERREAAMRTAMQRVGKGPLGGVRKAILGWAADKTQTFTVFRENQRYHLDYLLSHIRWLVVEQARRLTERGLIDEVQDVFFLTGKEFYDAVAGRTTDRATTPELLEERRQHFLTYRDRLPASFLFDEVETEGELAEGDPVDGEETDGLSGLGASRGVARGRVRVVPDLTRLADVQPGEILVANNIDPGWTPVFPLLAGLVTETGGILSHGAILAREYGIPTVTGVAGATRLLESGVLVEVDGNRGVIEVVEEGVVLELVDA